MSSRSFLASDTLSPQQKSIRSIWCIFTFERPQFSGLFVSWYILAALVTMEENLPEMSGLYHPYVSVSLSADTQSICMVSDYSERELNTYNLKVRYQIRRKINRWRHTKIKYEKYIYNIIYLWYYMYINVYVY